MNSLQMSNLKFQMMKISVKIFPVSLILGMVILLTACTGHGIPVNIQDTLNKYVECWNTGNFDGIEDILAEDFTLYASPDYRPIRGIDSLKKTITSNLTSFPDFNLIINETVFQEDKVGAIWTVSGTNTGQGDMPPTGKAINGKGLSFIHLQDGKIKDEWLANNNLLFMEQLGFKFTPPTPPDTIK